MRIELASEAVTQHNLSQLNALLIHAANNGASIGWIPPLNEAAAERYWRSRILLLAWEGDTIVGSGQLGLEQRNPDDSLHATVLYYKILS